MKKIVYIGNNLKNANPTTIVGLSSALEQMGNEVFVASTKKNRFIRLIDMIFTVFKNKNADYVLIDTYSTKNFYFALIISQFCRVFKISYIPILHGGNLKWRLEKNPILSKLLFKNAFYLVTPSHYLQVIFKKYGYDTTYIPNGIDLNQYKFKPRKNVSPKLLWVRAFDAIYNPQMAIQVLELLIKKYPKAQLCMVGPDKDGSLNICKNLVLEKQLEKAVTFKGKLSKKEWIALSVDYDIFINTTTIDNIPVSVIEAMALGLPVISTNVGGIPYLIENNFNGLLIENNDYLDMLNTILILMEKPQLVENITKNARNLILLFDWEIVKNNWYKILN